MASGLGSGTVVGAGWTDQVGRMGWTPTATVAPPDGKFVEVWWMNRTLFAQYNQQSEQWIDVVGTVLEGVTHWREIRK